MLLAKLVRRIEALGLDLRGRTVLTEAASGAYVVTPLLAALAGAKVYAFAKTTSYGTVAEIFAHLNTFIDESPSRALDITLVSELSPEIVAEADVITNSGHLRPLTQAMLAHAKDSAVIPLMYEAWEWREADMDLSYIRQRGFTVGATNERHPDIDVFSYLGDMAVKQIFDAGLCLRNNKFVLICNNAFGPYIAKVVATMCDGVAVIDRNEHRDNYHFANVTWLGNFPEVRVPAEYRDAEAVIFTAYPFDREWIGEDAVISVKQLKAAFTDLHILRYAGDLDVSALDREGVRYFPPQVRSGHMGILPSAVGYDPIIRLQAGGLKAAEAMLTGQYEYHNIPVVELI